MNFVRVEPVVVDGKNVLKIIVCRGSAAPYYIAGKGIRPEGVYVRRGTASSPATQTEILNMIRDTSVAYEDMRSIEQNLTFVRAGQEFDRAGLPFGDAQRRSLGIVGADGCFTNLGYLLSDQCAQNIKFAVFDGYEKEVFRDRHEFGGSLFGQIEDTMRAIDIYNRQSSPKTDGLLRQDRRDYPEEAIREALLNAVVHRDYAMGGYTLISMFDDRIEFVSLGGLMRGVEMEDIMLGVSYLRNKKLADVFYRLHLIEAYGTGLAKIKASYTGQAKQPVFESTQNAFKVVLYKTAAAVVQTRGLSPVRGTDHCICLGRQRVCAQGRRGAARRLRRNRDKGVEQYGREGSVDSRRRRKRSEIFVESRSKIMSSNLTNASGSWRFCRMSATRAKGVDKAASFRYNCLVAFAKRAKGENNGRRKARCRDDGTARAGLNARVCFRRRHRGSPQEGRLHFKTRFCLGCGGVRGRFGQPLAVPLSRRKVRRRDVLALLCAAGGHVRLQPSCARDRDRAQDGQGRHRRVRFAQQKVQVVRLHLSRCADHHHSILQCHRRLGGALQSSRSSRATVNCWARLRTRRLRRSFSRRSRQIRGSRWSISSSSAWRRSSS